jgi:uncharacterized membrane protein YccC
VKPKPAKSSVAFPVLATVAGAAIGALALVLLLLLWRRRPKRES